MAAPSRSKLNEKIKRIDCLLNRLEAARLNPVRILAASLAAHERKQRKVTRATT